jgi:hypothetical protein
VLLGPALRLAGTGLHPATPGRSPLPRPRIDRTARRTSDPSIPQCFLADLLVVYVSLLLTVIGDIPPSEREAIYYAHHQRDQAETVTP